ncbi:MAG: magnesium transporter CorA [Ideonella sp. MAG2]|nr:MAG: magnesium transporter CorA [Ideonella sp. MAG2]
MRLFVIQAEGFSALEPWPAELPEEGFLWLGCTRAELNEQLPALQSTLQRWLGAALVDLHTSDLLNAQLPSHFEDTSWYDMLVFRRLAAASGHAKAREGEDGAGETLQEVLQAIDTNPVGFAIFDRVLLTVHPDDCQVLDHFAQRLAQHSQEPDLRGSARLPTSPADLMLRMVNHMVDSYLELRRMLTRQFTHLQAALLAPRSRFDQWPALLAARDALHHLEDTCEDQRSAIQEWIDALDEWPVEADATKRRERELLRVRSRDVLEHIERVLSHVRRLEQSADGAVQMHFSALSNRTNDIMRTLTVLTAIFLPLNLITGIFGMNFDALPLIHSSTGFFVALGLMACVGLGLGLFFWRKRYLGTQVRR